MSYLHAFDHVHNDFDRVERLVDKLTAYYGGPAYGPGYGHP